MAQNSRPADREAPHAGAVHLRPLPDSYMPCPCGEGELVPSWAGITGMRNLARSSCTACCRTLLHDLPAGQALWSPAYVDEATGELLETGSHDWLSWPLRESYRVRSSENVIPVVHKFRSADRVIILNCLDDLYGHCFLKLLNAQRHLEESPELGCIVIIPSQLMHLVPAGVSEIWEVKRPLRDFSQWFVSLEQWIDRAMAGRTEVYLSPAFSHPDASRYDIDRFVHDLPAVDELIGDRGPVVLFSYREDRTWGLNARHQRRRLQRLYDELLAAFPRLAFVLVGFGRKSEIKARGGHIVDVRCAAYSEAIDRQWLALMKRAHLAIGVHGSNMLLPSALSRSVIDLVPANRLGNFHQDILGSTARGAREAALRVRFIYGSNTLLDVTVAAVARLAVSQLTDLADLLRWYEVDTVPRPFMPIAKAARADG